MWTERLWLFFNTVGVLAAAVYAVVLRLHGSQAQGFDLLMTPKGEMLIYTLSGCILLVNLGFIIYALATIDRKLVFRNEQGEITVSLRAVETALSQVASTLDGVHAVKVKFYIPPSGRGPIKIDVLGVIKNISDLRELTQKIQALIKYKLSEMLQIEGDIQFNVHFSRTHNLKPVAKPAKARPRSAAPALESLEDYGAAFPIKYPVEHDES